MTSIRQTVEPGIDAGPDVDERRRARSLRAVERPEHRRLDRDDAVAFAVRLGGIGARPRHRASPRTTCSENPSDLDP